MLSVSVPGIVFAQSSLIVDTAADETDDGECAVDCTLREAIALVAEGGTITFDAALDGATIDLTQGQLQITRPLTVDASALTNGLTVDATGKEHRVMDVTSGTASGEGAVIIGLTISGGSSTGIEAKAPSGVQVNDVELGGGIRNSGQLRLERSTLTGNKGELEAGSAIWSSGTLTLLRSTLTNNQNFNPSDEVVISGGTLTLQSSTISDDGILNQGGVVTVEASTLIGDQPDPALRNVDGSLTLTNSVASEIAGCTGTTVSHSLIEDGSCITPGVDGNLTGDPILGLLADYGGPTLTHLPLSTSPLIDAGDPAACPAEDQRGETRPFDGDSDGTAACDIGAVERSESDALARSSLIVDTATDEADDGECDVDCTLREAIALVNNNNLYGGTITFDTGVSGTINLTGALPDLSTDITIQGPGADVLTVRRDTGGNYRIFTISSGSVGAISGLTISGGSGGIRNDGVLTVTNSTISGNTAGTNDGGGIQSSGTLTVTNSTISGNTARVGGGINASGIPATVTSSTISGNTADLVGGGILNTGTLTVNSSTISGNTADPDGLNGGEGGGLWNQNGAQATLRNSIVAGNVLGASTPDDVENDGTGTVTSEGYNLVGEDGEGLFTATGDQTGTVAAPLDPLLGPLRDNGGPTLTHLPRSSSPAIDAGDTALAEDQRGTARPQEGTDDIGAVERSAADDLVLVVDTATDGADDGECASDCTLREAIALANADPDRAVITFDAGVTGTINLTGVLPDLVTDITIQGPGAGTLAVDSSGAYRVFTIAGSGVVAISGLTISGGSADNGGGLYNSGTLTLDSSTISGNTGSDDGGGVYNEGTLTVMSSTISGNTAGSEAGGGIYNSGTVAVSTSTISGNNAGSDGGGILNFGTLTLNRSTITANIANRGGGIYDSFGTLTVGGSIVADNDGGDNIVKIGSTPFTSEGYNLIGDNNGDFNATGDRINTSARLGPLQDNGGLTLTHLPLSSSPAINGGDPATCSGTDQRGQPRPDPVDGVCDIGAVELQDPPPLTLVVDTIADEADDGECTSDCTLREALSLVPYGGTIMFDAGVTGTINLNSALPDLSNVTIQGPGADVLTVRRNAGPHSNLFTNFTIPIGRTVAISGLTLTNGRGDFAGGIYNLGTLTLTSSTITGSEAVSSGEGGGIQNRGTLTVTSSTITGNSIIEGGGGGILNKGTLTVMNSTISGNSSFDSDSETENRGGGGILNDGTLMLIGSTVSGNFGTGSAPDQRSGGIYNRGGSLTLRNTIVAGNLGDSTLDDIKRGGGTITSEGHNLVGVDGEGLFTATGDQTGTEAAPLDPLLGPLQDNGGPTLTHLPMAGSPLIDAGDPTTLPDHFLTDDEGNPIDQAGNPRFTGAAIDIGAVETDGLSVSLAGSEGFRALSAPAATSLADLLAPIWTQGIPGTDDSSGDANLWLWNNGYAGNDTGGWTIPSDASTTTLNPGEGVLVYVFEDDQPGTPGSWPKTLSVSGTVPDLPFSGFTINTNSGGFTLLGNPAVSNIDWDEVTSNNLDNAVYVWDPSSGADGQWLSYVNGSGDLTGGIISPFQGFMVRTNGGSPSLEVSQTTTAGTFYGKESAGEGPIAMRLQLDGQELTSSVWLYLTEEGSLMEDAGDALKLQPFASEYALLSTTSSDGVLMDINHLPLETNAAIHLPLNVEATRNGTFTIAVTQMNLPDGWSAILRDHQTGKEMTINEDTEYSFELKNSPLKRGAKGGVYSTPGSLLPQPLKAKTGGNGTASRFTLIIAPEGVDIQSSTLPEAFALDQNYPNPFNPTTVISYQLPVNSEVRLEVYDMLGRNVATLVNEQVAAGRHSVNFDASGLSSGVYLYRLAAGQQIMTRKLTVVK